VWTSRHNPITIGAVLTKNWVCCLTPLAYITIAMLLARSAAAAGEQGASRDWHLGTNLRTDFGTHPSRIDGGVRVASWDFVLVVDPMYWFDGQHDMDALTFYEIGAGWWAFLGWRGTTIRILDGTQWQHKSLHGVAAQLPELFGARLRSQWGFELAVLWVKHGAGLPTEPVSFASARDWLDHVNAGMFVRFEYVSPF
jgi:hypothetical protein